MHLRAELGDGATKVDSKDQNRHKFNNEYTHIYRTPRVAFRRWKQTQFRRQKRIIYFSMRQLCALEEMAVLYHLEIQLRPTDFFL